MPTLADIYSAINTAKRKGTDFIQNPGTSLAQMLGNANDRARAQLESDTAATDEFLVTRNLSGPAQMQNAMQFAQGYNPVGMTVMPFGKARNVVVPTGQDFAAVNPVETRARQAIDELVKQAKYFGVDSPIDHTKMPVGQVMSHLDDYLGRSQQVTNLPKDAISSLRNLWYKAEDAANAYKRVYGENKLMGKMEEAANKETINKRAEWIPDELQEAYDTKKITKRQYDRQVMKNFKEFFGKWQKPKKSAP